MKNSNILKTILIISGLVVVGVGAVFLFTPVSFYAGLGVDLGGSITLLNDIRATGGGLLAIGILIMSGAFVAKLAFTATLVSALLYTSYGLARIQSIAVDGMPVESLLMVTVLELVIGLVCAFAFLKYRDNEQEKDFYNM